MLKSGARWRDCPDVYGPYTTIYNRFNRWSRQGLWTEIFQALTGSTGMYGTASIDTAYIKAHRSAAGAIGGAFNNEIGRSRGGQTTKIHAPTDDCGRPHAFMITRGNTEDLAGARGLIGLAGLIASGKLRGSVGEGEHAIAIRNGSAREVPLALFRQRFRGAIRRHCFLPPPNVTFDFECRMKRQRPSIDLRRRR